MASRRLSPRALESSALFYLRQRAGTVKALRRVLLRKVDRALRVHAQDRDEAVRWVDELLLRLQRNGYLDDRRFAKARAGSLMRRGASVRQIKVRLRSRGVAADVAEQAVRELTQDGADADWVAALAHAKRKRLGPFRETPAPDRDGRRKELAKFARAGFALSLAVRIVDARTQGTLLGEERAASRNGRGST